MARLPFLVEHGPIVWRGLAAIAAIVAIAAVRRVRAYREHRATARELAACAAAATAPVEGRATVRGTLRGGRAASVSLLHLRGPRPYYDERAPELWLDCDGQRVALDGAVRVVRGTRAVSSRDRRSAVPDDELAVRSSPILHRLPALAVSVRDGDEVFATARLAPRPGAEVRGYREATTVWTTIPDGGAIELVAAAPVVRAIPLGRTRSAALGAVAAGLAIAALWAAGGVALRLARAATGPGHRVAAQLDALDPLAVAAATPGHRADALAALEARFATRSQQTPEALALWLRAAELRGGCGGELEARIAQGAIDGLAELAQRCDDDRAAGDAYQLLGRFREAAERDADLPAGEQHIESLIAIGAWQRAGWWAGTQHDRASVRSPAPFACAEQWFRWLAGFTPAGEARAKFPHGDPGCTLIAALLVPDSRRSAAMADAALDREIEAMADALAWAEGTPNHVDDLPPSERVALHRAMFDPGDRTTIAGELSRYNPGSRPITAPYLLWQRTQTKYWGDMIGRQTCDRPDLGLAGSVKAAAVRATSSGDGRALAELLAQCRLVDAAAIEAVFSVWPQVREGRDRLADVLRAIDLGPPATDPLTVIGRAAMRRDLARLTGDAGRADAWQAIVERHLEAFSSHTALTALMVRELLRAADPGAR